LSGKHTLSRNQWLPHPECEELIDIAKKKGLVLMVGHTFLYSPAIKKNQGNCSTSDIGEIRYICAGAKPGTFFRRTSTSLGTWLPHDISSFCKQSWNKKRLPSTAGQRDITPGVEDVTTIWLNFRENRSAIIQSSWSIREKIREMTIVGAKK